MTIVRALTKYFADRKLRAVEAEMAYLREQLAAGHARLRDLTEQRKRLQRKLDGQSIMDARIVA